MPAVDWLIFVKGAYGVFAMTNFWDPELNQDSQLEQQQGRAMADAAAKAGVHHYIWRYSPTFLHNMLPTLF